MLALVLVPAPVLEIQIQVVEISLETNCHQNPTKVRLKSVQVKLQYYIVLVLVQGTFKVLVKYLLSTYTAFVVILLNTLCFLGTCNTPFEGTEPLWEQGDS